MNFTIIADTTTVGLYVGWLFGVIAALLLLAGVVATIATFRDRDGDWGVVALTALGTGVAVGAITLAAMWPLKYEYHHYVSKSGTVETVNKRLVGVGSENGASERYVVKFTDDPYPYGIDDTRAALLKPGDPVGIKCKKEHQFFQPHEADGWACRWGA